MLNLAPAPKVITFDCYGTLVQWHRAVEDACRAILARHVHGGEASVHAGTLAAMLRKVAMDRQQRAPFIGYKEVLRSSLARALAEIGHTANPDDGETLVRSLRRIEPHPDTPAALASLRTRYKLAIISNTDDDLIAETVAAIGVPIDRVITAQQAQAYKPDHRLFLHAYTALGVTKKDVVHVGMGQVTDLKVCHELGIRSVWIDRAGEKPETQWAPHAVLRDLTGLPGLLMAA